MRPTAGAVPGLFQRAPQRAAGLNLDAIPTLSSSTHWLHSGQDVPPRARSAPSGATTLALVPALARHAEHAPTLASTSPPKYRWIIPSLSLSSLCNRQPTRSRSRRTNTPASPSDLRSRIKEKC
jgi:hypothetical protein